MKTNSLTCHAALVLLAMASGAVQASDLVYRSANPSFGGDPFNGQYLLNNALAQVDDPPAPQGPYVVNNTLIDQRLIAGGDLYHVEQNGDMDAVYAGDGGGEMTVVNQTGDGNQSGVSQTGGGNSALTVQSGTGNTSATMQQGGGLLP